PRKGLDPSRPVAGQASALPATPLLARDFAPAVAEVWPVGAVEPRLIDLEGAARFLSVSVWTVRDLMATGELRRVWLPSGGRRVLLDVRDLHRLVEVSKAP